MRQALLERQTLKEKKKVIKINNGLIQYFVKVKINAENHDAQNKKIVYKESIILLFFFHISKLQYGTALLQGTV